MAVEVNVRGDKGMNVALEVDKEWGKDRELKR
jgi:hypothetical protein